MSSTLFQATLRADPEIAARRCHSPEIGYVPLGGDATVQWNSRDFQFRNNTKSDIRLSVVADNGTLTCSIYSKKKIDIGTVKIIIDNKDSVYTLTRTVDGKKDYSTVSSYRTPASSAKKSN